jgi:hypothetical protein
MFPLNPRHIAAVTTTMLAMATTPVFAGLPTPNQPPVISAPPLRTEPFVRVLMGVGVADPDAGSRPLTITLTLLGAGARPADEVGVMTWNRSPFPMQTDTETLTLSELNASLQTLRFVSVLGFAGQARVRIDVDDNAVLGPPGRVSVVVNIDVCGAGDITMQQCETNQRPRNVLPAAPRIVPGQVTTIPMSIEDPDVGAGSMEMEITLADHPGPGEPVPPATTPLAQIGSFAWRGVTGRTSDVFLAGRASLNQHLAALAFHPNPDFVGTARLVFEVDDQANSALIRTGDPDEELADTDFLILRVCGRDEFLDNVRCLRNDPPLISLPASPRVDPRTPIALAIGVDDPDTGARDMGLSIAVSDPVSGRPASSVGRFNWGRGNNLTTASEIATLAELQAALSTLVFVPAAGFAGTARLTIVANDFGGTGSGGPLTTTRTLDIAVCTAVEVGRPSCATNDAPSVDVQFEPKGYSGIPMPAVAELQDVDAGASPVNVIVAVADADGVRPAAQVGELRWSLGASLSATATLGTLRDALNTLVFTPHPDFEGVARITATVSDLGNSGTGGARTDANTSLIDIEAPPAIATVFGGCPLATSEGAQVRLRLERTGASDPISVAFTVLDGTAVAGQDFPANPNGTLSWAAGEFGIKTFTVPILADAVTESPERFTIEVAASEGALLDGPISIPVTIRHALGASFVFGDGLEGEECQDSD